MARPRKNDADRHPCGKIKRPTRQQMEEAQRKAEQREMETVLAQPHRRGEISAWCESRFGRFCLEHKIRTELFDAGEAYLSIYRQYSAAWGAPLIDRLGGTGRDIEMEQSKKWRELLTEWERAMESGGAYLGRLSVLALLFDRDGIAVRIYPQGAIDALFALAVYQGRLKEADRGS